MRIAIVDDIETERALLKMRLERQLSLSGVETEILEFDSSESFLAAEKERHFTVAFLDIYMKGLSGMDAAKELRKTDADCFLIFTTTSTDHALEGFQVRAFHYLVKPFSEGELAGLLTEMLAKLPRPEPILTVKVSGSDVRLRYRDIIFAEHFAHMINIRTTAGKTLATRQSFKAFTEPLKKDPRFFVCGRGTIVNLEHRPYRPKRRTRATIAKEKGLEPLANEILLGQAKGTKEELAKAFVSPEKGVESTEDAILGAMDILAEHISDDASFRAQIRKMTWEKGMLTSTVREEGTESVFETYYEFQAQLTKINGHQVLHH